MSFYVSILNICICAALDGCVHLRLHAGHEHVAIGAAAALGLAAARHLQQVGVVLLCEIGIVPALLVFLLPAHKLVHQQLLHAVDEPFKFGVRHGAPNPRFMGCCLFGGAFIARLPFIHEQRAWSLVVGANRGRGCSSSNGCNDGAHAVHEAVLEHEHEVIARDGRDVGQPFGEYQRIGLRRQPFQQVVAMDLFMWWLPLLLPLLRSFQGVQFVFCRFQPHGQLLHERKEVMRGHGCIIGCEGGACANLFQGQAGGFVGSEAGTSFEVERAVAAFVVSRDLRRDCCDGGI